jgi:hypothetical protein
LGIKIIKLQKNADDKSSAPYPIFSKENHFQEDLAGF